MRYRAQVDEQCEGRLVLTYSAFDAGALWLYPEAEWRRVRDEVMALSTFNASHRSLQRRLVGSLGFGGNGRRLAKILAAFRCRILATDKFPIRMAAGAFSCRRLYGWLPAWRNGWCSWAWDRGLRCGMRPR